MVLRRMSIGKVGDKRPPKVEVIMPSRKSRFAIMLLDRTLARMAEGAQSKETEKSQLKVNEGTEPKETDRSVDKKLGH